MICKRRLIIALTLLSWALSWSSGCSMFTQTQEPKRPKTVEEFIAQPRVQPY
jgi:hypothetical protein